MGDRKIVRTCVTVTIIGIIDSVVHWRRDVGNHSICR